MARLDSMMGQVDRAGRTMCSARAAQREGHGRQRSKGVGAGNVHGGKLRTGGYWGGALRPGCGTSARRERRGSAARLRQGGQAAGVLSSRDRKRKVKGEGGGLGR
jgi:hypothetical protein